jgi:hypothetical protein
MVVNAARRRRRDLPAGGRFGFLRAEGLYVTLEAPTEELILEAARALQAMPG